MPHIHAATLLPAGQATLRDFEPSDADAVVHYFYENGDEALDQVIDRARLPGPDRTRQFFLKGIRSGDPRQRLTAFAIDLDETFIGYTTLQRESPDINYSHWHITCPAYRSMGVSTALYPHRIQLFFDLFPIRRLIHRTAVWNHGVNRMLDRFAGIAERQLIEQPEGLMRAGEYYIRHINREDVPRLISRVGARTDPP